MNLPKTISDAIIHFTMKLNNDALDALKRAIADNVSPVAPTEAEIEAWGKSMRAVIDRSTTLEVTYIVGDDDIEEGKALMRRAATATPAPSAKGSELVCCNGIECGCMGVTKAEEDAYYRTKSLERLRKRAKNEISGMALSIVLRMIDEEQKAINERAN